MSIKVSKRLIDLFPFKKINKFSPSVTTADSAKFLLSKNLKDWYAYDPSKTGADAWILITSKDLRNIPEDEARAEILKSTLVLSTLQTLGWNTFKDFWSTENENPNMIGVAYTFEDVSKFIDIKNFEVEYDLKGDHKDDIVSKKLYGSFNNFKVGELFSYAEDFNPKPKPSNVASISGWNIYLENMNDSTQAKWFSNYRVGHKHVVSLFFNKYFRVTLDNLETGDIKYLYIDNNGYNHEYIYPDKPSRQITVTDSKGITWRVTLVKA